MAHFVFRGLMQTRILFVATCSLASLWLQTPIAMAQHGGGHSGGAHAGAPHVFVPPVSRPTTSRPTPIASLRPAGADPRFHFQQRPIRVFRRRHFFGAPFFRFGVGLGFNFYGCPNCCPYGGWGFDCYALPFLGYGFENYVTMQPYEPPEYLYAPQERDVVWLYMKDGAAYSVIDYWFVSGQLHFIAVEEGGAKSAEHTIGLDELDVQRTIDVNTRRGFRVVMRDEPLEQYLRDHPDPNPQLLQPSQKN